MPPPPEPVSPPPPVPGKPPFPPRAPAQKFFGEEVDDPEYYYDYEYVEDTDFEWVSGASAVVGNVLALCSIFVFVYL